MNDRITIMGKVATDPTQGHVGGGVPVTNFRVASSQGRFDNATQTWIDGGTNWYSVAAFRHLAVHAKASLRTGDSVIVTGRLKIRNWESNGKQGTSIDIDAETIGHDLRWGTSAFAKAVRPASSETRERVATDSEADKSPELDPEEAMALTAAVWAAPDASDSVPAEEPVLADAETTPF